MIDLEATGKNIRNIMKITGYTARELERLIGCTQMTFFNVQAAGLLHDTLEDTDTTPEEIKELFGEVILAIVQNESEDKSKTWKERKQHTIDSLAQDSIETMQVCCADKLSNCKAQLYDYNQIGYALFDKFCSQSNSDSQAWYYKSIVKALKPLSGMKMYEELCQTVSELYG